MSLNKNFIIYCNFWESLVCLLAWKDQSGVPSGPCAQGYGVCCIFDIGCGGSSSKNLTYFSFSGSAHPGAICTAKICRDNPGICQFRLDFDVFVITDADSSTSSVFKSPKWTTYGQCQRDTFQVWSAGSPASPILCGTNSGYHMYIDASDSCADVTFVISPDSDITREWTIKISHIDCQNTYKAPDNCLQWYTGKTGTIESFNFKSGNGKQLSGQDYSICIRAEKGYCSLCFSANSGIGGSSSFRISRGSLGNYASSGSGFGSLFANDSYVGCGVMASEKFTFNDLTTSAAGNQDYLIIPGGTCVGSLKTGPFVDRFCGTNLDCAKTVTTEGIEGANEFTVCTSFQPFLIRYVTDSYEDQESEAIPGNIGFLLNYWQLSCA